MKRVPTVLIAAAALTLAACSDDDPTASEPTAESPDADVEADDDGMGDDGTEADDDGMGDDGTEADDDGMGDDGTEADDDGMGDDETGADDDDVGGGDDGVVTIVDNAFDPEGVEVAVGDSVEWQHDGEISHNVTFDDTASDTLEAGDSYSQTFDEEGEFDYSCTIHAGMDGSVTVTG